jgi:hypothetical protein
MPFIGVSERVSRVRRGFHLRSAMNDSAWAKSACEKCGVHIEFPSEAAGRRVACPTCGKETELGVFLVDSDSDAATESAAARLTVAEVVSAFAAPVPPTSVSVFYQAGLILVAAAMVLLPILYVVIIGVAAWGVYFWATHFTFLLTSPSGVWRLYLLKLAFYCGPLFAGAVMVLFMVKPLFARRAPRAQPLALNPIAEPVLFTFVAKICENVGAPLPNRIDLDCHLNASASFRRGARSFLGNDLVLTIGLPLVAALSMREFAGVLAHEFGHFTQALAMRLNYVIRSVNGWFGRVVYERDAWDLWLEELAETESTLMAIRFFFTRQVVLRAHCIDESCTSSMRHSRCHLNFNGMKRPNSIGLTEEDSIGRSTRLWRTNGATMRCSERRRRHRCNRHVLWPRSLSSPMLGR